jgi:hypothetical protein
VNFLSKALSQIENASRPNSLPHLGREWIGPPPPVCLDRTVGVTFTYFFVHENAFGRGVRWAVADLGEKIRRG